MAEERQDPSSAAAVLASRAAQDPSVLGGADATTRFRAVEALQQRAGNAAVQRAVAGAEVLGASGPTVQRFSIETVLQVASYMGEVVDLATLPLKLLGSEDREQTVLDTLVSAGMTDADRLSNVVFLVRHPERIGNPLGKGDKALIAEWKKIRRTKVKQALGGGGATSGLMSESKRRSLIEKAKTQARSGSAELTAQMEATLPEGTTVDEWFAGIEPDAQFLGMRIRASAGSISGVHRLFRARLDLAAANLRGLPGLGALSDDQLRQRVGLRDIGGLRKPKLATGGDRPSYHCFGMAVDINPERNPFVGNFRAKKAAYRENESPKIIGRAVWLMRGEVLDVRSQLQDQRGDKLGAAESWEVHHNASEALAQYLRLADDLDGDTLAARVEAAQDRGDTHDLAWWKRRIADDDRLIQHYDFGKHPDPEQTGYMDLTRELVVALTDAGLRWGGTLNAAKDIMHFDYRGPLRRAE